jgi:hypothetical protein
MALSMQVRCGNLIGINEYRRHVFTHTSSAVQTRATDVRRKSASSAVSAAARNMRWTELLTHLEDWLNGTLSDSTGYSRVELIFDRPMPDTFERFLKKETEQKPPVESLQEMVLKTYVKMKGKADKRNRNKKNGPLQWNRQAGDMVLARKTVASECRRVHWTCVCVCVCVWGGGGGRVAAGFFPSERIYATTKLPKKGGHTANYFFTY